MGSLFKHPHGVAAAPVGRRRTGMREDTRSQLLGAWPAREDGQTMAEYAVVLAVITIAVFGALGLLSGNIVGAISRVAGSIT